MHNNSFEFDVNCLAQICVIIGKCKQSFFCSCFMGADKPPIQELHQFLEFQLPRQWAPVFGDIPLGPDRKQHSASLQFSLMGPKLYVNKTPVILFSLLWENLYSFLKIFPCVYLFTFYYLIYFKIF